MLYGEDAFASAFVHELFGVGRAADQGVHSIALLVTQIIEVHNPTQTRANS